MANAGNVSILRPLLIIGVILAGLGIVLTVICWLFFLHTEVVEPGHELVINDKPYFVGHDGVRDEPVREGRIMLWRTSSVDEVRMTPQSIPVRVDDFSSRDSILLDFETTIQWRVVDSVTLVKHFGSEWFKNNIHNQYLSIVRDAVKTRTMAEMMSDPNVAQQVDDQVTNKIRELVKEQKLPIEIMNISLGRAKPNNDVLEQMNKTAAEQQRERTMIAATAAEKQREQEQKAKAAADNAYRNAMAMSPEQFVQLEYIRRMSEACSKSTCVIGQPGIALSIK